MADSPPASRIRKPRESPPKKKDTPPSLTKAAIRDKIADQVTMCGMMVGAADPIGGFILLTQAEDFGSSWAEVAAVNPRVKRILEGWFSGSVYANAAASTAALAIPLATHYKLIPRAWFNPASQAVTDMEKMIEDGTTLDEMLTMHRQAKEAQEALRNVMREAAANANGGDDSGPNDPDHYEAPAETTG